MIDAKPAEGADPDLAELRAAHERRNPVVRERRYRVVGEDVEPDTIESGEPLLGTDPEKSMRVLRQCRDRALRQPLELPPRAHGVLVKGAYGPRAGDGRRREREHDQSNGKCPQRAACERSTGRPPPGPVFGWSGFQRAQSATCNGKTRNKPGQPDAFPFTTNWQEIS